LKVPALATPSTAAGGKQHVVARCESGKDGSVPPGAKRGAATPAPDRPGKTSLSAAAGLRRGRYELCGAGRKQRHRRVGRGVLDRQRCDVDSLPRCGDGLLDRQRDWIQWRSRPMAADSSCPPPRGTGARPSRPTIARAGRPPQDCPPEPCSPPTGADASRGVRHRDGCGAIRVLPMRWRSRDGLDANQRRCAPVRVDPGKLHRRRRSVYGRVI
jgi:hypothetical protein